MKAFLGGTCNDSTWRSELIKLFDDKVEYFDPVVDDWDEEARLREIEERKNCDVIVYVITPRMTGVYSIAEVVDDSNKRPDNTILCILPSDNGEEFSEHAAHSLKAVVELVIHNGGMVADDLSQLAAMINEIA